MEVTATQVCNCILHLTSYMMVDGVPQMAMDELRIGTMQGFDSILTDCADVNNVVIYYNGRVMLNTGLTDSQLKEIEDSW